MADGIVRVSFEWDCRKCPRHPHVEGIVQEQIRQRGADDPTLRGSCRTRNDATVLHLDWSLQPAFDVENLSLIHIWFTPDRISLADAITATSEQFQAIGMKPGCILAVAAELSVNYALAYLAAIHAGLVVLPVNLTEDPQAAHFLSLIHI